MGAENAVTGVQQLAAKYAPVALELKTCVADNKCVVGDCFSLPVKCKACASQCMATLHWFDQVAATVHRLATARFGGRWD